MLDGLGIHVLGQLGEPARGDVFEGGLITVHEGYHYREDGDYDYPITSPSSSSVMV